MALYSNPLRLADRPPDEEPVLRDAMPKISHALPLHVDPVSWDHRWPLEVTVGMLPASTSLSQSYNNDPPSILIGAKAPRRCHSDNMTVRCIKVPMRASWTIEAAVPCPCYPVYGLRRLGSYVAQPDLAAIETLFLDVAPAPCTQHGVPHGTTSCLLLLATGWRCIQSLGTTLS